MPWRGRLVLKKASSVRGCAPHSPPSRACDFGRDLPPASKNIYAAYYLRPFSLELPAFCGRGLAARSRQAVAGLWELWRLRHHTRRVGTCYSSLTPESCTGLTVSASSSGNGTTVYTEVSQRCGCFIAESTASLRPDARTASLSAGDGYLGTVVLDGDLPSAPLHRRSRLSPRLMPRVPGAFCQFNQHSRVLSCRWSRIRRCSYWRYSNRRTQWVHRPRRRSVGDALSRQRNIKFR